MLVPAVYFWQIALAVHIIFVVAAFGIVIAYPAVAVAAERIDRRSVPVILRTRKVLGRSLVNPGLGVVVIAGVYLASELHQWHTVTYPGRLPGLKWLRTLWLASLAGGHSSTPAESCAMHIST